MLGCGRISGACVTMRRCRVSVGRIWKAGARVANGGACVVGAVWGGATVLRAGGAIATATTGTGAIGTLIILSK
jgi:hypothetical protein